MQQQNLSELNFSDQDSFHSHLSSNRSLDRMSRTFSNRSLNFKQSMVEVLDVDCLKRSKQSSDRNSQVDEDSVSRQLRFSGNSSKEIESRSVGEENHHMFEEIPNFMQNQTNILRHQCQCLKQGCCEDGCPCILAVNETCVIGLCCTSCIQSKNRFLANDVNPFSEKLNQKKPPQSKYKRENSHLKSLKKANRAKIQKEKYDFVYCTCKKTQCMKKYCPCFALNKKCNQCCICQDCQNHSEEEESDYEKKQKKRIEEPVSQSFHPVDEKEVVEENKEEMMMEEDIDNYFQDSPDNYDHLELNKVMDFEPVDLQEFKR